MADPISAIGLAQQCYDLAKAIYDYVQAVKEAPAERLILSSEMQNIADLIQLFVNLGVPGTRREDGITPLPGEISGPMDRMAKRMDEIRQKLGVPDTAVSVGGGQPEQNLTSPVQSSSGWRDRWKRKTQEMKSKGHEAKMNLKWPFEKEEVIGHLNALERDKTFMTLYLQGNDYMLSRTTQSGVDSLHDKASDILSSVKATQRQVGIITDAHFDQKTRNVLEWLSELDFAARQRQLCAEREIQEATGEWFLSSQQIRTWLSGNDRLVYATGVAGSGKTMLVSITIEHLRRTLPGAPVAFIFFDQDSQRDYGHEAVMSSILRQFLQADGKVPSDLVQSYDARHASGDPPDPEDVLQALKTHVARRERLFIVLDALDEFSSLPSARSALLEDILPLAEHGLVHILVTARTGHPTHATLERLDAISVKAHTDDVRRYLEPRLEFLPAFISSSIPRRTLVVDGICTKVQDMFILAHYHLQAVDAARSPNELHRAIEELPTGSEGLGKLYGRCLERLDRQAAEHRARLYRMLDLLVCCRRPLQPGELVEALALNTETGTLDADDRASIDDLVMDTEGLVRFDREQDVVRLAHETVYHFLSSIPLDYNRDYRVAEICLTYLSLKPLLVYHPKLPVYKRVIGEYAFFDYAAMYWGEHVKLAMESKSGIQKQVLEFLQLPYRACDGYTGRWLMENAVQRGMAIWKGHSFDRGGHRKTRARAKLRLPRIQHAIHFGLTKIVEKLLEEGDDPNGADPDGLFLNLNAAVQADRLNEARLLLDYGADPNALGNTRSPLNWAAECASLDMVRLLVERGANLDLQNEQVDPPLCTACEREREDVADYLIRQGADLDNYHKKTPFAHRTPLSFFMDKGRPKCRRLLLFKHKILTPERGQKLLLPMENARLVQRLVEQAGTSPHQTFGLGHGALDVALRLQDTELLQLCLQLNVQPRLYWDLAVDSVLRDLADQHPQLRATLAAQAPPTFTIRKTAAGAAGISSSASEDDAHEHNDNNSNDHDHDKEPSWKADYKHAFRTFLHFEVPPPPATTTSSSPSKIIFTMTSHDQGWSSFPHDHGTYHGGASVFHAEIAHGSAANTTTASTSDNTSPSASAFSSISAAASEDAVKAEKAKARQDLATPIRPRIVQNVHASATWKTHVVVWERGDAREEVESWMRECTPGRVVRVVAQAADEGWENHVRDGRVDVWWD